MSYICVTPRGTPHLVSFIVRDVTTYARPHFLEFIVAKSHKKEITNVVTQAGLLIAGGSGKQLSEMYEYRA